MLTVENSILIIAGLHFISCIYHLTRFVAHKNKSALENNIASDTLPVINMDTDNKYYFNQIINSFRLFVLFLLLYFTANIETYPNYIVQLVRFFFFAFVLWSICDLIRVFRSYRKNKNNSKPTI